jgi:hypothetical protein
MILGACIGLVVSVIFDAVWPKLPGVVKFLAFAGILAGGIVVFL